MEEHNTTNEKETKHKQYECPCCKIMIGLHNKRHKDNLITVKEETQTEEPKTEKQLNVEPVNA